MSTSVGLLAVAEGRRCKIDDLASATRRFLRHVELQAAADGTIGPMTEGHVDAMFEKDRELRLDPSELDVIRRQITRRRIAIKLDFSSHGLMRR